jgi:hypothetical protein
MRWYLNQTFGTVERAFSPACQTNCFQGEASVLYDPCGNMISLVVQSTIHPSYDQSINEPIEFHIPEQGQWELKELLANLTKVSTTLGEMGVSADSSADDDCEEDPCELFWQTDLKWNGVDMDCFKRCWNKEKFNNKYGDWDQDIKDITNILAIGLIQRHRTPFVILINHLLTLTNGDFTFYFTYQDETNDAIEFWKKRGQKGRQTEIERLIAHNKFLDKEGNFVQEGHVHRTLIRCQNECRNLPIAE